MAKKSSESYRPERRTRVKAEDIFNRQLSESEKAMLARHARRQSEGNDSQVEYGDIPPIDDEQLAKMVRFRDRRPKVAVSVRLDAEVLEWLKSKGEGHLRRINDILANVMEAEQRVGGKG